MTSRIGSLVQSSSTIIWAALFSGLMLFGSFLTGSLSARAEPPKAKGGNQPLFRLEVQDAHGAVIAASDKGSRGASAVLAFEREYQPGDRIVVNGPSRMAIRVDNWIPECLVYLANSPQTAFSFDIPYGQGEPETRSAFSRDSFGGQWHRVIARE